MNEITRTIHYLKKAYKKTSYLHSEKSMHTYLRCGSEGRPRKTFRSTKTGSKMIGEV